MGFGVSPSGEEETGAGDPQAPSGEKETGTEGNNSVSSPSGEKGQRGDREGRLSIR